MSWNVSLKGTKEAVRAAAEKAFDAQAAVYGGTSEGADILVMKGRALAAIDELEMEPYANGIELEASGSCSKGFYASASFKVSRIKLEL